MLEVKLIFRELRTSGRVGSGVLFGGTQRWNTAEIKSVVCTAGDSGRLHFRMGLQVLIISELQDREVHLFRTIGAARNISDRRTRTQPSLSPLRKLASGDRMRGRTSEMSHAAVDVGSPSDLAKTQGGRPRWLWRLVRLLFHSLLCARST